MFTRIASLGLATAALVFSAAALAAEGRAATDNTLQGSVNSVMDGSISILGSEGKKITTFKFDKNLEIVYNGKKGDLKDLKTDLPVTVTFKTDGDNTLKATKIESNTNKPGR